MLREPYVAGYFYPSQRESLIKELSQKVEKTGEKDPAIAMIAPHAGYMYSGEVAGAVYSSARIPDRVVLLGPSHRPLESRFALMRTGAWGTPLGKVPIDSDLADRILAACESISEDSDAHQGEHSLEVQLPFLRYLNERVQIVPISITYFAELPELLALGHAVAAAIQDEPDEVLIVASTDMSHQVKADVAREKDNLALDQIKALNAKGLYDTVRQEQISMCGFQATTAALAAALDLGAEKAEVIAYRTSGDVTGDFDSVVGYAGIRVG
jgi:AmmeMemoRadiSam system protein B